MKRRTVGAALMIASALIVYLGQLTCRNMRSDINDPMAATDTRIYELREIILGSESIPTSLDEVLRRAPPQKREELRFDGYGNEIKYTVNEHRFELRAPSKDGVLYTDDDYVLEDSVRYERKPE